MFLLLVEGRFSSLVLQKLATFFSPAPVQTPKGVLASEQPVPARMTLPFLAGSVGVKVTCPTPRGGLFPEPVPEPHLVLETRFSLLHDGGKEHIVGLGLVRTAQQDLADLVVRRWREVCNG